MRYLTYFGFRNRELGKKSIYFQKKVKKKFAIPKKLLPLQCLRV